MRSNTTEKESGALPQCHLEISPFETEPVQTPIPSPASTTAQPAETCSFSVGSADCSEGIESARAVSNDDTEGTVPNEPLRGRQRRECKADNDDPQVIAQQNFAVAMNLLKIVQKERQQEHHPTFLDMSARAVKGIVSCFSVTT
mmetsp:Transcript_38180/g.73350  ORF Transcript_38180/g.73350 Transcript_38180/m.73350 type:complete len:144 (+) Transcript_38180:1238-1669(+)